MGPPLLALLLGPEESRWVLRCLHRCWAPRRAGRSSAACTAAGPRGERVGPPLLVPLLGPEESGWVLRGLSRSLVWLASIEQR